MDWYGIPRACVNIKNFTQVRIGDTLAPEIKYWHPDQPVFISAQTGAGKSHFIIHTLLPHVLCACPNFSESAPESILVLSNRLANNKQFKLDLNKQVKQEAPNANWSKIQRIGNVCIYTYQNILSQLKNIPPWEIRYIVLDEAHFFIQDASFNPDTHAILQAVLSHFPFAVRIYMSATFQNCALPIYELERRYIHQRKSRPHKCSPSIPQPAVSLILNKLDLQQSYGAIPTITKEIEYIALTAYAWYGFNHNNEFRTYVLQNCNLTALTNYYKKFKIRKILQQHAAYFTDDPPEQNIQSIPTTVINFCCSVYPHISTPEPKPAIIPCTEPFTELKAYILNARYYAFGALFALFRQYILCYPRRPLAANAFKHIYDFLYAEVSYRRGWFRIPDITDQVYSQNGVPHLRPTAMIYLFQREYSSYQIYKYHQLSDDLAERIVSRYAQNPQEKWLIFVNRKESGQELYSQLCDTHQIPTIFIHSAAVNAKNSSGEVSVEKQYCDEMIERQCFPDGINIVITTSVLDSGISLWEPELKHIVLATFDEVALLQMIGRKRFDPKTLTAKINLYFPVHSTLHLKSLIQQQQSDLELIQHFQSNAEATWKFDGHQHKKLPRYVRWIPQKLNSPFSMNVRLETNQFALIQLRKAIEFAEQIQTYIKENPTDGYAAWAANKLGISEIHDIPQSCHNTVLNLIHEWNLLDNDISLSKEELETFYNEFLTVYNEQAYGYTQKDKQNNRTKSQINNAFKNLKIPYSFIKRNNRFYLQSVSNKDD